MKSLLTKDLLLSFQNKTTLLLYLVMCLVLGFSMEASFLVSYTAMLWGIMALSTISMDEQDNGFAYLMTLPIQRKTYVKEKLLFGFLMEVLGTILGIVLSIITSLMKGESVAEKEMLLYVPLTLGLMQLMISGLILIDLKYGTQKSRQVLMLLYGAIALFLLAVKNIPSLSFFGQKVFLFFQSLSPVLLIVSAVLCVLLLQWLLYALCVRVMEKKEF